LVFGVYLSPTPFTKAADKSGVSPNAISLPSGPGSIEGLGEAFQPTLNTGTAKYGIDLLLPNGTAGHAPSLSIRYEGGNGNGPLGFGWDLPIPSIQRQSDKGIPRYVDEDNQIDDDRDGEIDEYDERDVFINEMKEELVPQADGYFFCENEGAFIRYQKTNDYWAGTLPSGVRMEFGVTPDARVQDQSSGRVYRWCLERVIDTHGNTITYQYESFPGANNLNQIYCSEIDYGPGASALGSPNGPPWDYFHFARFDYEDRSDWFEDGRAGFLVRTGKRLSEISIGTQGPSLAGHLEGDFNQDGQPDYLNRRYRLTYLDYAPPNSHWSLLHHVTLVGADGVSELPPATFNYIVCDPPAILSAQSNWVGGENEPPQVMDNPLVDFVDLNADGLPDVLRTAPFGGGHLGYLNLGERTTNDQSVVAWSAGQPVGSEDGLAYNVNLESTGDVAHLADMDGDGLADLVNKSTIGDIFYFANLGSNAWARRRPMSTLDFSPPSPFGNANARAADIDFDKRVDIIESIDNGFGADYRIWFNLGQQRYSQRVLVPQTSGFLFSDPGIHLVDFNGDRVPDVVRLRTSSITITAGLGHGRFADPVTLGLPTITFDNQQLGQARFQDITGDGLADLLLERASPGQLWYWINLGNYTLTERKIITDMPLNQGANSAIRWADLNGNGTTDLIYADSAQSPKMIAVDIGRIIGCVPRPHLLTRIENGIGRVSRLRYASSIDMALRDAQSGQAWPSPLPFPVSVVAEVVTEDSLGNAYTTEYRYHDGYYDAEEKEFRGFARVEQSNLGDTTAPTLVTVSHFDTGRQYEALKGKLLRRTAEREDGTVFWTEETTWTQPPKTLRTGVNGQEVRYAHPLRATQQITELGRGEPRFLESELDYDEFGNQTLSANYGIVADGDRAAFDDERIIRTEYAINTDAWLLRYPSRVEVMDENDAVISRTETFYDDETFSGSNPGQIVIGNTTLTRDWIDPNDPGAFIDSSRAKYDAFGNATMLLDPLAIAPGGEIDLNEGHVRQIVYDDQFHAYPLREIVHLGQGAEPLTVAVDYDKGFATIIRSSDLNANVTTYAFDAFARIVNMVNPGDTEEFPTAEYDYVLAKSFGEGGLVNYVESRLLDKDPSTSGGKRDHYYISRKFSDGLGRPLMLKHEAEKDSESGLPRVVVKDAVTFNARMATFRTLNPYFSKKAGDTLDELLDFEDVLSGDWRGVFHEKGELLELDFTSAHKTSTEYDALLRSLKVTHPDGTFGRTDYEPLVTINRDENDTDGQSAFFGTPTIYAVDGLGRHIRTDEVVRLNDDGTAGGELNTWTTRAEYDLNDQLIRLTDSQNNVKSMRYDGLRRMTRLDDPDRGSVTNRYDAASNIIETTDTKDQRITYTYDGVNRLLTEDYHDENESFSFGHAYDPTRPVSTVNRPDVAYFYDVPVAGVEQGDGSTATARNAKGKLAYVWDLTGEEHTSYDERGRVEWTVKRIRDPVHGQLTSYRTAFAYDSTDRLRRLVYPDNDEVRYEYNDRNLFERITGGPTGFIVSNFDHLPAELKEKIHYGNGLETTYTYDERLRLNSLRTVRSSEPAGGLPSELVHFDYELDAVSNLKTIHDRRPGAEVAEGDPRRNTQSFTYDDLYRLTGVGYSFNEPANPVRDDGRIQYRYDRIGNMLAKTATLLPEEAGSLDDLGTMISGGEQGAWNRTGGASEAPGPHALSEIQKADGEILGVTYDANGNMTMVGGLKCVWDFQNRLVAVENDTMRAEYVYDHSDRRIIKTVSPKAPAEKQGPPPSGHDPSGAGYQPRTTLYPGRHFEIRDHEQPTKYVWAGSTRIARVTGSLSSNERVQRLRVYPGWNLVSLAVASLDTATQLRKVSPPRASAVEQLFRWNPESLEYTEVQSGEDLPAASILWIKAAKGDTLTLKGTYLDPSDVAVVAGGAFYPGGGLEVSRLSAEFSSELSTWSFDSETQRWLARLAGEAPHESRLPEFLDPGQAIFVNVAAPEIIPAQDPDLRIRYYHQDHLGSSSQVSDAQGASIEESAFFPFGERRLGRRRTDSSEEYSGAFLSQ
jgi:YD repeat-containing protein